MTFDGIRAVAPDKVLALICHAMLDGDSATEGLDAF
jgi:hypothetical protein